MDELGHPINAHPLSEKESRNLAFSLAEETKKQTAFLQPFGLLPYNVLYTNPSGDGCVIWYSPARKENLLFKKELGINDGEASLPPLLWKASRSQLSIWALNKEERPTLQTDLYRAPFFNLYIDGKVCMGNVEIEIDESINLEKFLSEWERYFFRSAFSHLLGETSPVKGNIVQLWKRQVSLGKVFPINSLKKSKLKLKNII